MVGVEADTDVSTCLAKVRQGDEEAARWLLQHLHPLVLKIVRARLPRRTSEEDLVQIVFMKVFVKLDQYAGTAPFEHWVSRIAVNTCFNQLENERVRPELRYADLTEEEEAVLQNLQASEAELPAGADLASRDLVDRLLARLKPDDRLLVTLLYLEGHTMPEIRQITGWSTAVMKIRAFRARHKMRKDLRLLLKELQP